MLQTPLQISSPIRRKGFMFVLSSPSGAGKTTLSRMLLQKDESLALSISATTRPMRPNETEGVHYYFMDKPEFETMRANGEFLENAEVFGNYYGTPASQVGDMLAKGTDVLFDIDWQGTRQLTQKARQDVVSVFILPPSMEELELRLRKRAEDTEEVLQHRMSKANVEISHWNEYDYVVVNKDLEESLQKVYSILRAERLRRERQEGLQHFVSQLLKGKAA